MHRSPKIFGIVNVTEDSFSDGGRYLEPAAALAHARKLAADGADILDLGAAASNPNAKPVAASEEIRRLEPLVHTLIAEGRAISIDTFSSETQLWALKQFESSSGLSRGSMDARNESEHDSGKGSVVHYLNDIHGFADPAIYPELAASRAKLIVMHMVGEGIATREKGDPETIWDRVLAFFEKRIVALIKAGVARNRLILDPGMGLFLGAGREVSLTVLRELARLKAAFALPVLVSVSRKSFLRVLVEREAGEAGAATLAAELWAADHGADFIRTHDVRTLKDALTVRAALVGPALSGQG